MQGQCTALATCWALQGMGRCGSQCGESWTGTPQVTYDPSVRGACKLFEGDEGRGQHETRGEWALVIGARRWRGRLQTSTSWAADSVEYGQVLARTRDAPIFIDYLCELLVWLIDWYAGPIVPELPIVGRGSLVDGRAVVLMKMVRSSSLPL